MTEVDIPNDSNGQGASPASENASGWMQQRLANFGYTNESILFLGLSTLKGIGFNILRSLGGPTTVAGLFDLADLSAVSLRLSAAGAKSLPIISELSTLDQLRRHVWEEGMIAANHLFSESIRFLAQDQLPPCFHELPASLRPPWLFVRGNLTLLHRNSVAVVGTRKPSAAGAFLTKYAVLMAGNEGLPVVSGLAHGIDTLAHEACLEASIPTISVLGSGLLVPYPAKNSGLADEIVFKGGVLVSEYLPLQQPSAETFVWRNRLQACIAQVVIGAEWKRASGTAHTMKYAKQFNRTAVSLRQYGWAHPSDSGESDHIIELPTGHDTLKSILSLSNVAQSRSPTYQAELF